MKLSIITVISLCWFLDLHGQSPFITNYTPLRCEGPIPQDFITGAMEQFQSEQEELEAQKAGKANKKEKTFLLSGSYAMSRMLTSGSVLFGDPLTLYCNKVMGVVLSANIELKHHVRVYVVKSSEVNAFATDQGIIFVTVGLLAKLGNEAQLAFILSHELVHHVRKHSIDIFIEKQDIARGRGQYRQYNFEDRIMQSSIYNKDKEKEADLEGYAYYSKTSYSKGAPLEVMTMLEFSHTPFADSVFDISFFEAVGLRFPDLYRLDTIEEVEGQAEDEGETHPSIESRRDYLRDQLGADTVGGKFFLVSNQDFIRARDIARLELCRLYLLEQDYGRAMYNCYLLLQQFPDNNYLAVTMAKGLTGIAAYASDNDERDVLTSTSQVEGEMQRLYFLLNTLTEKGISIAALLNNYKLVKRFPGDAEVMGLYDNSIRCLAENYETLETFVSEVPADFNAIIDSIKPPEEKGKVKKSMYNPYDSSKVSVRSALSRKERKEIEEKFLKYALVEIMTDSVFMERYDAMSEEVEERNRKEELEDSDFRAFVSEFGDEFREARNIDKKGYRLGIDSLIIVDPGFISLNYRLRNPFNLRKSIEGETSLEQTLVTCASLLELEYVMWSPSAFNPNQTDEFNNMGLLNEWFGEQLTFGEKALTSVNQSRVEEIAHSSGASHALWIHVTRYKMQMGGMRALSIFPAVFPGFIPAGIYSMFVPRETIVTIGILYDLRTGEETATFYRVQNHNGNPAAIPSSLYDILWQINATR